jgi:acetolactate synthase-1/2/3 large subunit
VRQLARTIHEAFYVASSGRPGPVLVDIPKDIQFAEGPYIGPSEIQHKSYKPQIKPELARIEEAVELIAEAKRPIFYVGGGVVNSGPLASKLLAQFVRMTGYPCTTTLMGLGAFPASDPLWLGMLGMHGTYESNLAMHGCDVMIAVGARFDDRFTGKISEFAPNSKKIHIDIDPSQINKNVRVDVSVIGDAAHVLEDLIRIWKARQKRPDAAALKDWWAQINQWRKRDCLRYQKSDKIIKPQYALERLRDAIRGMDYYIATEVGQHQMWAAQFLPFDEPRRWLTSGGLGTMGYGLPAAIGCQVAHPDSLVVDISGDSSVMMNIQEMSTAVQCGAPIKVFILNNQYMGMVRQWQELLHGKRYSQSRIESQPDFVKLAEAFGAVGLRATQVSELDGVISEMIAIKRPVIVDVAVDPAENCFPMIPGGKAHNEILLGPAENPEEASAEEGMVLV